MTKRKQTARGRKVKRILNHLGCEQDAGSLAAATAYYWFTIKAALEMYGKTDGPLERNLPSGD